MITGRHFGSAIRLPALFVVLAVIPLGALGWLGWRLLEQDRALENQRSQERLEDTTTLVSHEIDRKLAEWAGAMADQGGPVDVPADAVVLLWDGRGLKRHLGIALPYYPAIFSPPEVKTETFADAEAQELREKDLAKAVESYRRLASTTDRHSRAVALVRLARSLRQDQRIQEALDVYTELEVMGDLAVAGAPAALLALHERAALLAEIGKSDAAKREWASLASALWEGRFVLDRDTFKLYSELVPPPSPSAIAALKMAEAVELLWSQFQEAPSGRTAWTGNGLALAAIWRLILRKGRNRGHCRYAGDFRFDRCIKC